MTNQLAMRRRFYSLVWHLSCAAMRFILAREHSDYDIPVLPSATQLPSSALSRTAIRAVAVRFVVALLVGSDGPFSRVLEETYHQLTNDCAMAMAVALVAVLRSTSPSNDNAS